MIIFGEKEDPERLSEEFERIEKIVKERGLVKCKVNFIREEDLARDERLPFNSWSRKAIEERGKVCTSRTRRYVDDPRVDWISPPLPLSFIKEYLYEVEGARSPEELQKAINQIFRKRVDEDRKFYVHFGDFSDEVD